MTGQTDGAFEGFSNAGGSDGFVYSFGATECYAAVECDDGIHCTIDSCSSSVCSSVGDDSICNDGQFCNGEEICDVALGRCGLAPVPACDFTSCSAGYCDETLDACFCN